MIRVFAAVALLLVAALAVAMIWQHRRYLHARRAYAQDLQPVLHSADAFHVVLFLELAPGAELFDSVRKLRGALEAADDALVVYAGKVALDAMPSEQLIESFGEAVPWDAVVCVQLASREAWDRAAAGAALRDALAGFARHYAQGMQRDPLRNLLIPQALLVKRIGQLIARAPSHFPFEPAPRAEWLRPEVERIAEIRREAELGRDAAVVVNLVLPGSSQQRDADREYVDAMFGAMAERGNGPMHIGRAVPLERGTRFESVAIVYYPGVDYFASMVTSRFYQGILGDKQLGDNQSTITVPILDRL